MPNRIVALDGFRAVCVSFVLVAHLSGTGIEIPTRLGHVMADLGVRGFFVLSGFLITRLLLRDRDVPVGVALRDFYGRRAFRILPAFYVYIAVTCVLSAAGLVVWNQRDAAFAATFTMNFHGERAWTLGHLWSLAVEEQFYLLWPLVLLLCSVRRASYVLVAAILVAPAFRIAAWYLWPAERALTDQAFPCVADSLATGCLLAILRDQLEAWPRYLRTLSSPRLWPGFVVACAPLAIANPTIQLGFAATAANFAIALVLHRCVARPARLLETPLLCRLGMQSYSLYLWQQLFVDRHSDAWYTHFPVNLGLALASATLSFHLIEQPFLRLAARLRAGGPVHANLTFREGPDRMMVSASKAGRVTRVDSRG